MIREIPKFPEPVLDVHNGIIVVRDDLLPGGSKTRFLPYLIPESAEEVVFGGPFCGGAPYALSVIARQMGFQATLFYAARKQLHGRQLASLRIGARIFVVRPGYMSNVQAKARAYCEKAGATFLPLGFDLPEAVAPFVDVMEQVKKRAGNPGRVFCATGSGMLARCLGLAFPDSEIIGVAVGLASRHEKQQMSNNVRIIPASMPFEKQIQMEAPFPSCGHYDRKAWAEAMRSAEPGDLFWNVAGPT